MRKKGMVIEVKGRNAVIMTEAGEFANVKCGSTMPICGEEYEGYEAKNIIVFRKAFITAAAAMFIFILGIVDYYNPVKAVELDMNSKIMLQLNRWNRVMTASAPDKAGKTVLRKINIKNIPVDKAVEELMVEAQKEKVIKSFSEVKVNSVKGNVDLSSIKSSIEKETSNSNKKSDIKTNEVKNENLNPQDNKTSNTNEDGNMKNNNISHENTPIKNNVDNNINRTDNAKNKTDNLNENSRGNNQQKPNNINNNSNANKSDKGNEKSHGSKKK